MKQWYKIISASTLALLVMLNTNALSTTPLDSRANTKVFPLEQISQEIDVQQQSSIDALERTILTQQTLIEGQLSLIKSLQERVKNLETN